MRIVVLMFLAVLCLGQLSAVAAEILHDCNSENNSEILSCLEGKRVLADKALNVEYKSAMIRLGGENKLDLREVQRKWIKFRDKFCISVKKENRAGLEAELEYLRCLYRITLDRKLEVQQLNSVLSDEKFYSAIIALGRVGIERNQLIEKLALLDSDIMEWREYTSAHCGLMSALVEEDVRSCHARLNLNRTYQ